MTVLEALGEPADCVVTIDFETYFTREYSLKPLGVEAYVRNPLFQVIGVGVKVGAGPSVWLEEAQFREWVAKVDWSHVAILAHHVHFDGFILAHHYGVHPALWLCTLNMGRALHGIEVGNSLAKLSAHYGLGEKGDEVKKAIGKRRADFTPEEWLRYGEYCRNDVDLTEKLLWAVLPGFPEQELWVNDSTVRLFTEPTFELDRSLMLASLEAERERKAALLTRIGAGRETLMSADKFAALLMELGEVPEMKVSPKAKNKDGTPKQTYAFAKTDPYLKGLLEHERDEVRWAAEARVGIKSTGVETRTERFLKIAERGRLPVYLRYCGAHTGRWSGAEKTNFQNLKRGGAIRDALTAPEGLSLIASDSAQIEARLLAWFAGHTQLVEAFAQKRDIYSEFATRAYGRPINRKRKAPDGTYPDFVPGFVGKSAILALGYGAGWGKFAQTMLTAGVQFTDAEVTALHVNVEDFVKQYAKQLKKLPTRLNVEAMAVHCAVSKAFVDTYREEHRPIPELWYAMDEVIEAMYRGVEVRFGPNGICQTVPNGIALPSGRRLRYPGLEADEDGWSYRGNHSKKKKDRTKIYGGSLTENIIQALARDVVAEQLLWLRTKGTKFVTTTHDELVAVAPEGDAERVFGEMIKAMSTPPAWAKGVPLAAEGGFGRSYGAAK